MNILEAEKKAKGAEGKRNKDKSVEEKEAERKAKSFHKKTLVVENVEKKAFVGVEAEMESPYVVMVLLNGEFRVIPVHTWLNFNKKGNPGAKTLEEVEEKQKLSEIANPYTRALFELEAKEAEEEQAGRKKESGGKKKKGRDLKEMKEEGDLDLEEENASRAKKKEKGSSYDMRDTDEEVEEEMSAEGSEEREKNKFYANQLEELLREDDSEEKEEKREEEEEEKPTFLQPSKPSASLPNIKSERKEEEEEEGVGAEDKEEKVTTLSSISDSKTKSKKRRLSGTEASSKAGGEVKKETLEEKRKRRKNTSKQKLEVSREAIIQKLKEASYTTKDFVRFFSIVTDQDRTKFATIIKEVSDLDKKSKKIFLKPQFV